MTDLTDQRSDGQTMSGKIAALEAQLREKEQLVSALTERLEQAAEQLDRVHRTGADRGLRTGGGGLPPEFIEQQKSLADGLQQAIQQWEDMQCAAALGRIEMQVGEIRDLIAGGGSSGATAAPARAFAAAHSNGAGNNGGGSGSILSRFGLADPESSHGKDSQEQPKGWEAMKASLLGDSYTPPAEEQVETPADEPQAQTGRPDLEPVVLGDPPASVDLETATLDELREAVRLRDDFIADLIRKLRYVEAQRRLYGDLSNVDNAPEEIRTRIQELEAHFDEKLRLAEVEHSVERARLSREAMRLRQLEEQLQKEIKRLGPSKGQPADDEDADAGKGGRWRRMLGIGKGDDD